MPAHLFIFYGHRQPLDNSNSLFRLPQERCEARGAERSRTELRGSLGSRLKIAAGEPLVLALLRSVRLDIAPRASTEISSSSGARACTLRGKPSVDIIHDFLHLRGCRINHEKQGRPCENLCEIVKLDECANREFDGVEVKCYFEVSLLGVNVAIDFFFFLMDACSRMQATTCGQCKGTRAPPVAPRNP